MSDTKVNVYEVETTTAGWWTRPVTSAPPQLLAGWWFFRDMENRVVACINEAHLVTFRIAP